ncbi:hypothetical protein BKN14_02170 [Candidatus Gracilibacteria bacterium HOT-871]|nr:hypothetical protein BKN14_02170 [Candidatus Gracilibacteria bacterium HOT-871]
MKKRILALNDKTMKTKAIVHIMSKNRMNSGAFKADIDAMEELYDKYGINTIIFYKGEKIDYLNIIEKLEKYGVYTVNYANKQDLLEKIKEEDEKFEILFVYTAVELMIKTANYLRQELGLVVSDYPDIFRDKSIQRKLLQENNPELGIKFVKGEPDKLDINYIEKEIGYPFIMKPVNGVQSSGVGKIDKKSDFFKYIENYKEFHDRLKARGLENKEIIVEEFIDGNLYTLDYFVTPTGKVIFSKPAQEILGIDFGFNDYCVVARVASKKVEDDLEGSGLEKFIKDTVKACKIKNTFVHHEFKLTSKGKLKTIELNGRFGGGRVDLFKEAYDMNLFEMLLDPNIHPGELKQNNIVFNICASKRGKLIGIDEKIFEAIKKRPTVVATNFDKSFVGKETGLTKDGFTKMGTIKLLSLDLEQITKDFDYIKGKYKKLLIIKSKEELIEERKKNKKGFFGTLKEILGGERR